MLKMAHLLLVYNNSKSKEDFMKRLFKRLEDLMIAITFAESGEIKTALEIMGEESSNKEELIDDMVKEQTDVSDNA